MPKYNIKLKPWEKIHIILSLIGGSEKENPSKNTPSDCNDYIT